MSTSLATGIVVAEVHAELEKSSQPPPTTRRTSRQPSATAAAARLPPEGPSHIALVISINILLAVSALLFHHIQG